LGAAGLGKIQTGMAIYSTGTVKVSVQVFPQESVKVTVKGICVPTGQVLLMVNLKALDK
jgi:hypothetical protein